MAYLVLVDNVRDLKLLLFSLELMLFVNEFLSQDALLIVQI